MLERERFINFTVLYQDIEAYSTIPLPIYLISIMFVIEESHHKLFEMCVGGN